MEKRRNPSGRRSAARAARPHPQGAQGKGWRQFGQVLPVALAGIFIIATATIYAYHSTRLTLEKTRLINAADAAAYSAAVEGARHMNFIAYTNRAMIANATASGMLVTYSSWARNLSEIVAWFDKGPAGFFQQVDKVRADKVRASGGTRHDLQQLEGFAGGAQAGNIDANGNIQGGGQLGGGGNNLPGQGAQGQGTDDPWQRRNSGPLSGVLDVIADSLGYMTIPIDLLNGLYAASQWAAWGTANSSMEAIAREVAETHDPAYDVDVSYPDATLMADGFFGWALPKRPGIDGTAEIKVPGMALNGISGFLRKVPVLGGMFSADMRAAKNHSTSLMKNYIVTAAEPGDAYYMFFSRGWRFCGLLGPVCAPIPLNVALEHASSTVAHVGSGAGVSQSAWKRQTEARMADGWQGSVRELLESHVPPGSSTAGVWRRVSGFPAAGTPLPSITGGVGRQASALALQRMLGEFGSTQALADAMGNSEAGRGYHFGELVANVLGGDMGSQLSGMNFTASDTLRTGQFVFDFPMNRHFLDGFEGAMAPFFAFGKVCPAPLPQLCHKAVTTATFADGSANLKAEWWRYYQGIWSYFVVPSAPHFGIDPPAMWIEVELEKPVHRKDLGNLASVFADNFPAVDSGVRMKHAARGELYYHRQPNSPYADSLGAERAKRSDDSLFFLPSAKPPGNRPRHFNQPEDNQSATNMAMRYWSSGKATQGSMLGNETGPYVEGSYGLVDNWFGTGLVWTVAGSIARQHFPRDQGEYANAFAPFWEARLIRDRVEG